MVLPCDKKDAMLCLNGEHHIACSGSVRGWWSETLPLLFVHAGLHHRAHREACLAFGAANRRSVKSGTLIVAGIVTHLN